MQFLVVLLSLCAVVCAKPFKGLGMPPNSSDMMGNPDEQAKSMMESPAEQAKSTMENPGDSIDQGKTVIEQETGTMANAGSQMASKAQEVGGAAPNTGSEVAANGQNAGNAMLNAGNTWANAASEMALKAKDTAVEVGTAMMSAAQTGVTEAQKQMQNKATNFAEGMKMAAESVPGA